MAKPKVDVIVNIVASTIIAMYCDNLPQAGKEIEAIEGISHIFHLNNCIHVHTDPRYDINELRDEIYELLTADVPDVFKE